VGSGSSGGEGPVLPALLQPRLPNVKQMPLGTPEKAMSLVGEMKQEWYVMRCDGCVVLALAVGSAVSCSRNQHTAVWCYMNHVTLLDMSHLASALNREGMDNPNDANNPWDVVSSHGPSKTHTGPSTRIGTKDDPYTARFGQWRHPPRGVPPPNMYRTFLFDMDHPFRRKFQSLPDSKDIKTPFWHPLQGLRFKDITV